MALPNGPDQAWYNTNVELPNGGYATDQRILDRASKPVFTQPLRDLPVNVVPGWDNVDFVRRTLVDLEWGRFQYAALLGDAMGRDDRIQTCFASRTNALTGLPFEFKPANQTTKARKLAEDATLKWPKMVDPQTLAQILNSGIMYGIGLAEKIWTIKGSDWTPRLRFWHASFIYWRWDTRSYWLITQDGQLEVPPNGGGRFVVYCPFGYNRGWMQGRIRSLPLPWLIRSFGRRDWARQSEVMGQTIKKAIVPQTADLKIRQEFAARVRGLGASGVLECPDLGEGKGKFDLELVEANALTWQGFDKLIDHAETAMSTVLLGQNLTTQVKGSAGGKAAIQGHENVRQDYVQHDAMTLSASIREGLIEDWTRFHEKGGDPELSPIPFWHVEPPEDTTQKATALQGAANAAQTFISIGMPVDLEAYAEEFGVPLLPEDQRPPPNEWIVIPGEEDDEDEDDDTPPPPKKKAKKGEDDDEDEEPPAKPKKKATGHTALTHRGFMGGPKMAQSYADAVAAKAQKRASAAMHRRLDLLISVVKASKSAVELREHLEQAFDHPKEDDLADLLEKAQMLAELAGRAGVLG